MLRTLEGKVAIVVGAGEGIGRATAKALARQGAKVMMSYHSNFEGVETGLKEIREEGGEARAFKLDQSDESQVKELMQATLNAYGAINVLVNNAATVNPKFLVHDRDVVNMDGDYWDQVMRVNLKGPMLTCKHVVPHMIKAGYGSIVLTGSGVVFRGDTVRTAYAASKNALHTFTMHVATQYGRQNVRCNLVSPGLILSPNARDYLGKDQVEALAAQNMVPFVGEPDDIANVHVFLASPLGRYITGQVIAVDGGLHIHQCVMGLC